MKAKFLIVLSLFVSSAFAQHRSEFSRYESKDYGFVQKNCTGYVSSPTGVDLKSLAHENLSGWLTNVDVSRFTILQAMEFLKKKAGPNYHAAIDKAYNEIIDPEKTEWIDNLNIDNSALGLPQKVGSCHIEVVWVKADIHSPLSEKSERKIARAKFLKLLSPIDMIFLFLDSELTTYDSEFIKTIIRNR